jgi:hypothetical protein
MAYFTGTRLALWLLVAFLTLLAFAAVGDQWIGYVRDWRLGRAAWEPRECALQARPKSPVQQRFTAFEPAPSPSPAPPPQAVFIGLLVIIIIVDAMFSNDADFIFEPSITNYARTLSRRDD